MIVALIATLGVAVITFVMLRYLQPSPVRIALGAKSTPQAIAY